MSASIFYPETYGARGDGITDDTSAIQQAIDAASVSGGKVVLTKEYLVSYARTIDLGMYTGIGCALWVNAGNVSIEGPGSLVMKTLPDGPPFVVIAFGNGGTSDPLVRPGETGTWTSNVHIRGVTVDMSAFTKAELQSIGTSLSGCIAFSYCRNFSIVDCTILNGFGFCGAITAHTSSKFGRISGNRILGAAETAAMWFDGLRASVVSDNVIVGDDYGVERDINGVGIAFAANSDNLTSCSRCTIANNTLINCKAGGIATTGNYLKIVGNHIVTAHAGNGIAVVVKGNHLGNFGSSGVRITGNTIERTFGGNYGNGIRLAGFDVGGFDGSPIQVENTVINGNAINGAWLNGIALGEQAINSTIVCNVAPSGIIVEDGVTTATGNVTAPNY